MNPKVGNAGIDRRGRRIVRTAIGAGCATCILAGLMGTEAASAYPAAPAFYTFQAPYGGATGGQRVISLGFDDGPGPYTPQVLSVLEQYHVPATFFEIGVNVAAYPQYARQLVAAGYPVENHTWSHPDLALQSPATVQYQIGAAQNEITSVTGETPTCLRPPYNAWSAGVLNQIAANGLQTMSYSLDPRDWALPGTQAIVNAVVNGAFPGAVVDLHDGGGNRAETVAALPQIITQLEARGYTFVSICQPPPAPPAPPPPPPLQVSSVNGFGSEPAVGTPATSLTNYVGGAQTASGYWMAASNGGVFAEGVPFYGSMGGRGLSGPITGMAATPDGGGYWLVSSNGGVFSFGDAPFYGSLGLNPPPVPLVAMATDPATGGYWLVTSIGTVYSYNAPYEGGMGSFPYSGPIVGIASTPDGGGYWLTTDAGAVFSFGDATYQGGMFGRPIGSPVVSIATDPATGGYYLASANGGVFAFDAPFDGSNGGGVEGPNSAFAVTAMPDGSGYMLMSAHPVPRS